MLRALTLTPNFFFPVYLHNLSQEENKWNNTKKLYSQSICKFLPLHYQFNSIHELVAVQYDVSC